MVKGILIRLVCSFLLAMGCFLVPSRSAFACSCPEVVVDEVFSRAERVFVGRVIDIPSATLVYEMMGQEVPIKFEVTRVWKGAVESSITLYNAPDPNIAPCAYTFALGQEYLVYARKFLVGPGTGMCDGTVPLSVANEQLAELGEGQKPLMADKHFKAERPTSVSGLAGLSLSALLLVLLVLLSVMLRRRPRNPRQH